MTRARPVSLVAERAVRYLAERSGPTTSLELAGAVLSLRSKDEDAATRILEAAFGDDPRLRYREGAWVRSVATTGGAPRSRTREPEPLDPDHVLILLQGARPSRGQPFRLRAVAAIRLQGEVVVSACGGDATPDRSGEELRSAVLETLDGAVPVVHDPPGALGAFERWIDEPIEPPISLRKLAQSRLGLPGNHDLGSLAARLGLGWRESDDPLDAAEALEACLGSLREPGESFEDLRRSLEPSVSPIPWDRFEFDRSFLRSIPRSPGTYRFFDADGTLLYVGKSKNLHRRVGSYFREGATRSRRVDELVENLRRIEITPLGSDLEAVLREASEITRRRPAKNVKRKHHARVGRGSRLDSILILEPAAPPVSLWAYLIRDGKLLDRVGIGPRGGGLRRVERILEDHFFSYRAGPTSSRPEDIDVELVARWLSVHRDKVVAFDPTHLRTAREVTDRLRWFLGRGALFEPDGTPLLPR